MVSTWYKDHTNLLPGLPLTWEPMYIVTYQQQSLLRAMATFEFCLFDFAFYLFVANPETRYGLVSNMAGQKER